MSLITTREEGIALHQFYRNIGDKIHKARIARKITIDGLSSLSGISTRTLEKYERGDSKISFEVLIKLAAILNVEFEEFFKANDNNGMENF